MPKIIDHDDTRDAIADAFVRAVAAKGAASVTMREIAREAGISQTLPLYYFDNRDALVEFAFARQAQLSTQQLLEITRSDEVARDRLGATICWLAERSTSNQATWRTIIGMIVENRDNSRINELDRQCYNQFLAELEILLEDYRTESGADIAPKAEAIMLLTSTDGLALATASLGSAVEAMVPPLIDLFFARYGLGTGSRNHSFAEQIADNASLARTSQ
jgi:AcrR family transcriptional regulator